MEIGTTVLGLGPDLEQSLRAIVAHFHAQIGTIHTLESDGMLHMRAHTPGIPEAVLSVTRVIPIGKGIAGLAVERKAPVNLCNLQQDKSGDARPGSWLLALGCWLLARGAQAPPPACSDQCSSV